MPLENLLAIERIGTPREPQQFGLGSEQLMRTIRRLKFQFRHACSGDIRCALRAGHVVNHELVSQAKLAASIDVIPLAPADSAHRPKHRDHPGTEETSSRLTNLVIIGTRMPRS